MKFKLKNIYRVIHLCIPRHVAIIMDGNGRWAKKRLLKRYAGHIAGAKAIKPVVLHCNEIGVEVLTLFAFSTENWNRPKIEVAAIMKLMNSYLNNMDEYIKYGVRIKFFGDFGVFSRSTRDKMLEVEEKFKNNKGMLLAIALNYGSKNEIKTAVKDIALKVKRGEIMPDDISEDVINGSLYTKGLPDVDLLIRPGGEYRISNFLLWQLAYAELIFMDDVLWPDFKPIHIDIAIEKYRKRNRRYGNVV